MPEVDLSAVVPEDARWVRVQFGMEPIQPNAELIARVWSGHLDDAVVIRGLRGVAVVRLMKPQKLSYQRPVTVDLSLKVVGYSTDETPPE